MPGHSPVEAFLSYVRDESAETDLLAALRGIPRQERERAFQEHRAHLEDVNAARAVILQSLL